MAATAPKRTCLRIAKCAAVIVILVLFRSPLLADRADDVRAQIGHVATSLSSGTATDAMVPFDKSYVNYDKLEGYFEGLASFEVGNELDVTDEEDTEAGTNLTISWTLTLTDRSTNQTERRTAEILAHLILRNRKWKIVDFSPIEIFNPLQKQAPRRTTSNEPAHNGPRPEPRSLFLSRTADCYLCASK